MKFEYRSLICKITSVVCFGLFLFLLSKFVLQGFGSINHLAVFGLNQNLGGGKIISIIAFAIFLSFLSPLSSLFISLFFQSLFSLLFTLQLHLFTVRLIISPSFLYWQQIFQKPLSFSALYL